MTATATDMPAPARTIDTSGRLCPYPIVETAKAVRTLEDGAVLLVIATDPGVAIDMPMWCKATRNEHLGTFAVGGGAWKSWVRRGARRAQGQPDEAAPPPQGAPTNERGFAASTDLERAGDRGAQPHRAPR